MGGKLWEVEWKSGKGMLRLSRKQIISHSVRSLSFKKINSDRQIKQDNKYLKIVNSFKLNTKKI